MATTALGRRVKDYRLSRLWTQKQMAAFLEVSLITVARIEAGKKVRDLTKAQIEQFLDKAQNTVAA